MQDLHTDLKLKELTSYTWEDTWVEKVSFGIVRYVSAPIRDCHLFFLLFVILGAIRKLIPGFCAKDNFEIRAVWQSITGLRLVTFIAVCAFHVHCLSAFLSSHVSDLRPEHAGLVWGKQQFLMYV